MVIQGHTADLNSSDPAELGLEREQKLPPESIVRRALQSPDPSDLNARLVFWTYGRTSIIERRAVIAIDGKAMHGASTDRPTVLEYATDVILIRQQVADRSIEIPALPELFKSFVPDGIVVTADVLRSQVGVDGGLVGKKLHKRLHDLRMHRAVVRQRLECTDKQLRHEAGTVLAYLDLLADPGRFYELASPMAKRKPLIAFYTQI